MHGLGVDPGDNTLYVASHNGVFLVNNDCERERVADRWQDTMGFAVVGPGHFLGSGHPDLNEEDLPSSLGLIESTDGAETWDPVSLLATPTSTPSNSSATASTVAQGQLSFV